MAKVFAYKGNIIGGGIGEDIKVTQTGSVSTNADYEILLSKSANDTTETDTVNKASGLTYNPSTNQLKINGTAVLTQHQDISGKVNKSGDTMSGNLTISKANSNYFISKTNTYARSTSSNNGISSDTDIGGLLFRDKNDVNLGDIHVEMQANGNVMTSMYAQNTKTDGSTVTNMFSIYAQKNGTQTYYLSSPANFRSALGLGSTALSSLSWDEGLTVVATLGDGNDTIGHSNRITAGTIGTSSATSGATLAVPYATYDSNGHIKTKGTHTHTITGLYHWRQGNRTGITQSNTNDYWTVGSFPAKSGYSRYIVSMNLNNRDVIASYYTIESNNDVRIYTHKLASTAQSFNIDWAGIYLKDSEKS